jgi:hypothetical protein
MFHYVFVGCRSDLRAGREKTAVNTRFFFVVFAMCALSSVILLACSNNSAPTKSELPAAAIPQSENSTAPGPVAVKEPPPVVVSNLTLSSEHPIEGDTVVVTAKIKNPGSQSAVYKSVFYVDKQLVKSEDVTVDANSSQNCSFSIRENSTCMRFIENGDCHKLLIFRPRGNPDEINRASFNDYYSTQPAIVFREPATQVMTYQGKTYTFSYYKDTSVVLMENFGATNPSYLQLIDFLATKDYAKDPYATETMYNDAEAAGVKCAFVWWEAENAKHNLTAVGGGWLPLGIGVSDATMLNAFKTRDKGLVFVDPKTKGYILYVEKGKPVGILDLPNALYSDYSYFEAYSLMVDSETARIKKLNPPADLQFPTYSKGTFDQQVLNTGKCDFYW